MTANSIYEVFTALLLRNEVFWDATQCGWHSVPLH